MFNKLAYENYAFKTNVVNPNFPLDNNSNSPEFQLTPPSTKYVL